jgi:uncharacterized integral membrane protein (TIGR00698 family)
MRLRAKLPGILICFFIALPSWFIGKMFPAIGAPIAAIFAGIVLSALRPGLGLKFSSKKLLQFSIILLGFQMNFYNVFAVGGESLLVMSFTLSAGLLTAFFAGKLMKLPGNARVLIGVGTSICGASAIAAAAPVIQANDEDVARSISTVFLYNIIAVFVFPALGRTMGLSDAMFGMWAGTAINDTSSVVAAAVAWSSAAGNDAALQIATIVKLTRALMIIPVTLALAVYVSAKKQKSEKSGFDFVRIFPWFVILFLVAACLNTFFGIPENISGGFVMAGKFTIVIAMASVGLNTNLKSLFANGYKPIILGLCCWFAVAAASLAVQWAQF